MGGPLAFAGGPLFTPKINQKMGELILVTVCLLSILAVACIVVAAISTDDATRPNLLAWGVVLAFSAAFLAVLAFDSIIDTLKPKTH